MVEQRGGVEAPALLAGEGEGERGAEERLFKQGLGDSVGPLQAAQGTRFGEQGEASDLGDGDLLLPALWVGVEGNFALCTAEPAVGGEWSGGEGSESGGEWFAAR